MECFIDFPLIKKSDNLTCAIINDNLTPEDNGCLMHCGLMLLLQGKGATFYITNRIIHGSLEI